MIPSRGMISAICICSIAAVAINFSVITAKKLREEKNEYTVELPQRSMPTVKPIGQEYTLKTRDGCLAVFEGENMAVPIQVTDIYVASLRNYDREQLEQGITVYGRDALYRILEDFGS